MLLVRTPQPYPTESLAGYLIRAIEANGYDSITTLFTLAGVPTRWQGRRDPGLDQLERIINLPPGRLQSIATSKKGHSRFAGRVLGHVVSDDCLASSTPRICPDCVKELGFIEAHWELGLVIACARHRRTAVWSCQDCGKALSLYRPRLLRCGCGADLANQPARPAREGVLELQGILRAVALCEGGLAQSTCGLPAADLMAMSLGALLAVISRLGEYGILASDQAGAANQEAIVDRAAAALSRWPEGFHSLLRQGANKMPSGRHTEKAGIMSVYRPFYDALFKRNLPPNETEFLRRAFAEFKAQHAITPRTTREMVISNVAASSLGDTDGGRNSAGGRTYGESEAAAQLGIPVRVVNQLCESGHLRAAPGTHTRFEFRDRDLGAFSDRFPPALGSAKGTRKAISLSRALHTLRCWHRTGKRDLVVALLEQKIRAIGRSGGDVGGFLLDLKGVKAFLADTAHEKGGRLWSIKESADFIDCGPTAIRPLANLGWLEDVGEDGVLQISDESLTSFHSQFVSVENVARQMKVSVRLVLWACRNAEIEPMTVRGTKGRQAIYFIGRVDAGLLQVPGPIQSAT